jgi:hypothetical protein
MTRSRALQILAWTVLMWGMIAFASTAVWAPAPPGDPDCYPSARWTGTEWEYGRWVCFEEPLPSMRDPRREQKLVPFDPLEAWREMDVDVLADVALGEDPDAVAAVAWTVLNRSRESGRILALEVRRGRAYGTVAGGRFLPAWSQVPGRRWIRYYPGEWWRARRIARAVLEGRLPDPTGGATHFHREETWVPPWAPEPTEWVLIGQHAFYEEAS